MVADMEVDKLADNKKIGIDINMENWRSNLLRELVMGVG